MPNITSSTAVGMQMARAAAARNTRSRPAPVPSQIRAGSVGRGRLAFLQGAAAGAAPVAALMPRGNARAEAMRAKMPTHLTAMIRSEGLQNTYGPIVGPRAHAATVASFQGLDGFSIGKLTRWVTSATAAIASKDPAAILSVAAAAVPGGKTPPPAPKPQPMPQPTQVEQMFTAMRPQNNTQTMMMVGAGVLGIGLVALLLKRR